MKKYLRALFLGAFVAPLGVVHATDDFADQVISYTPGTGINSSFETSSAALGAPASSATMTAPPFLNTDIVGVGNGGQLTIAFNIPIPNNPTGHAGGMDFTIFGNEFFTLSGSTIAGLFDHPGLTVWVSQDNITYYQLAASYGADDSYPTQGNGNAFLPVNPSLSLSNFTGQTTAQALALYNGSAGGASFSISSAEDAGGHAVALPSISYIKVEGTSGFGYVDSISRVQDVPEPSGLAWVSAGLGWLLFRRRRRAAGKSPGLPLRPAAFHDPSSSLRNKSKQMGARNSVRIGSSCAAVTGYDFSKTNRRVSGGEGEKKASQEPEYSPHFALIRAVQARRGHAADLGSATNLLREKRRMRGPKAARPRSVSISRNLESCKLKNIIARLFVGAVLLCAARASAQTFTLSNIQYVVGSGPNEAALVIAWNDGKTPDSLVWGYRWSGTAPTIYGMMQAIESADPRFSFTPHPSFPGASVYSVYYDLTGLGGTPVVGTPEDLGGTENGHAPHPGDHYEEGWFTGFWGELIATGNPYNGGAWDSFDGQGVGVDTVSNNSWFGLSFTSDETTFNIPNPGFPTAVPVPTPEPSAALLLSLGAVGLCASRKRRRA